MFFHHGVDLYYEVNGHGTPLILIAGLTAHSGSWPLQVPVFSVGTKRSSSTTATRVGAP